MADVLSLLRAYSSGKLGPDDAEVVEALLTDYLDGMLDPAFEAEVTAVIASDPALAEDVESATEGWGMDRQRPHTLTSRGNGSLPLPEDAQAHR